MDTKEFYQQKYKTNIILDENVCLFMIDFQPGAFDDKDCINPMYKDAIPHCIRLLKIFRSYNLPVIHFWMDEKEFFQRNRRRRSMDPGFYSSNRFYTPFHPLEEELKIKKPDRSAFFGTDIESFLFQNSIKFIVMAGTTTSGCVRSSACDADMRGYTVIIPEECVWDRSKTVHEANMFDLRHKYAEVWNINRVEEEVSRLALSQKMVEVWDHLRKNSTN
jgi:maleamate amidohydrolase